MTNTISINRISSLGAVHGNLARFCTEQDVLARLSEDVTEVRQHGRMSLLRGEALQAALRAFEAAWMTAWERGQVELGRLEAHLTAPAARKHGH